jgi:hypothetical protein
LAAGCAQAAAAARAVLSLVDTILFFFLGGGGKVGLEGERCDLAARVGSAHDVSPLPKQLAFVETKR